MRNKITNFSVGLKALIINDKNEVLITRRARHIGKGGFWDIPGGRMGLGETLRTALCREIKEETGLEITKVLAPVVITTFIRDVDLSNQIVRIMFPCLASGDIKLDPAEIMDYKWISPKDYPNYAFVDENFSLALAKLGELDKNTDDFLGVGALKDSLALLK